VTLLQTPIAHEDLYDAFRRAEDFLESGRPADEAVLVQPVVDADPGNVSALELQARALFSSAQLHRAETSLRRLVEVAPADGWARLALARTLERLSRPGEAVEHRRIAAALGVGD
jgi:Flp pilus assembly protein TadD